MTNLEPSSLLVIACGALAREIEWLKRNNAWDNVSVKCLDAELHNHPDKIPDKLEALIAENHDHFGQIFVAYGDCGTGGRIDKVLARWNIERLPGAHCYSFYATEARFNALAEAEPGTFYLTDFLVRHFDRLVIRGLKLDRHPQLLQDFFGHYRRVIYLAQQEDEQLQGAARRAANYLGLRFETLTTGMGDLGQHLERQVLHLQPDTGVHHAAY
ncbi:DUF1638 domain-containing protein [Luminiphilus sp.]|jgi:hypothetical protein|nr:DUF1638 domain-containing protein [Luminiphilus sp.]MDA9848000.1 DUF1638 domain-containing protein [Luminiphilus sp.]MDB4584014.1 DUF1638 domain-containing protein [Draconibacterium sp.]